MGGDALLAIAADRPTVWLVSIDDIVARERAEAVRVSATELADAASHTDAGRRLWRRRCAKLMLAAASGCRPDATDIRRNADGAPVVTTPAGWHLSVAARWPDCAIGVAPHPLGVDIEATEGQPLPFDLLTAAEQGLAGERRGARCWAAKEAHAKWTGRPRELDPAAIETALPPLVTSRFGTSRCWCREAPDHVAAVCAA